MASGGKSQIRADGTAGGEQPRDRRSQAVSWLNVACDLLAESQGTARQICHWAKSVGLSEAELRLLWCLRQLGSDTFPDQKRIAEMMGVSAAQVSGLVQRLQTGGLIIGAALQDDRRRQCWRLAPAGSTLLDQVVSQIASQDVPINAAPARTEAA